MRVWWPVLLLLLVQGGALGQGPRVTPLGRNLVVVALTERTETPNTLTRDDQSDGPPPATPRFRTEPSAQSACDAVLEGSLESRAGPLA